ncbi:MAG: nucleotidyltransferase family protein, partial [Fimbriimonadaceae bacterium]|nr:nucleotidyltransferase family protein [Alphaproteobacteria bacterium]
AAVRAALQGLNVRFAHNDQYEAGLSTSLRTGIEALDDHFDGVLICLGDMPGVKPELLTRMVRAFNPAEDRLIVVPTYQGKRGNPVVFSTRFRAGLLDTSGDGGARFLLNANEDVTVEIEADASVALDIDTEQALDDVRRRYDKTT